MALPLLTHSQAWALLGLAILMEVATGEILAMAGASPEHAGITGDLTYLIRSQLRGGSCRVYPADLRVRVTPGGRYSYPDLVVSCDTPVFDDSKPQALINSKPRSQLRE